MNKRGITMYLTMQNMLWAVYIVIIAFVGLSVGVSLELYVHREVASTPLELFLAEWSTLQEVTDDGVLTTETLEDIDTAFESTSSTAFIIDEKTYITNRDLYEDKVFCTLKKQPIKCKQLVDDYYLLDGTFTALQHETVIRLG